MPLTPRGGVRAHALCLGACLCVLTPDFGSLFVTLLLSLFRRSGNDRFLFGAVRTPIGVGQLLNWSTFRCQILEQTDVVKLALFVHFTSMKNP